MHRVTVPGFVVACLLAAPSLPAQSSRGPTLSGVLQLREAYQADTGLTATVHLARLYVDGSLADHFTYRVSADLVDGGSATTSAGVSLKDAYVRWTPRPAWAVTVGQFKTPFSREYLLQPAALETADRAAVAESLPPKRDIGVMAAYAWRSTATLSVGAFNGEGDNSVTNRDSTLLAVGRLAVHPADPVEIGANVAAYSSDSTRYGVDGMITSGSATARAEFIGQHHAAGGRNDVGWYVIAAYRVRPHVQLVLRQEDLRRPAVPEPRNIATTAGTNLESGDHRVRLTLDYVSRQIGATRGGVMLAQLQLSF
jgi:hypothetical protein